MAFCDAVGHGFGNRVLSRAEHLHGLLGTLDRDLVEQDRRRLAEQIRRYDSKERGEAVLVVRQSVGECRFDRASTRAHDEVDVGHFVTLTDERFTHASSVDLCHRHLLPGKEKPPSECRNLRHPAERLPLLSASGSNGPDRLAR